MLDFEAVDTLIHQVRAALGSEGKHHLAFIRTVGTAAPGQVTVRAYARNGVALSLDGTPRQAKMFRRPAVFEMTVAASLVEAAGDCCTRELSTSDSSTAVRAFSVVERVLADRLGSMVIRPSAARSGGTRVAAARMSRANVAAFSR